MKDQSDKYNLSTEIIAAYLDGNATPAEVQLVLDAMAHDAHLRELLLVSSHVDTELALLHHKPEYIPMTALAAECGEDNLCCLECEKFVMKGRGITYNEQQMLEVAPWLAQTRGHCASQCGTPLGENRIGGDTPVWMFDSEYHRCIESS